MDHSEFPSVMWRVAELVLGTFKHGKDLDGILALKVVFRRPDACWLAPSRWSHSLHP